MIAKAVTFPPRSRTFHKPSAGLPGMGVADTGIRDLTRVTPGAASQIFEREPLEIGSLESVNAEGVPEVTFAGEGGVKGAAGNDRVAERQDMDFTAGAGTSMASQISTSTPGASSITISKWPLWKPWKLTPRLVLKPVA